MDSLVNNEATFRHALGEAPKLTTSNHYIWSKAVTFILQSAQAWEVVSGEEERPEVPATSSRAQDRTEQYEAKLKEYKAHYYTARAILYQFCTPSL
ncbi:MAG: hypothetical protein M1840_001956 [Geoglossum simile]|nr:MAG: hypothetical protein M1840_001956 [Geoglossum simile]